MRRVEEDVYFCRDCIPNFLKEVAGKFYHGFCKPIEWHLTDAFNKFGFSDGNSRRCYTGDVAEVIERLNYEVECDGRGGDHIRSKQIKPVEIRPF